MWPTHYIPRQRRPGVPPARFYLTTPPYPLEITEALLSSGDFDHALFGLGVEEELQTSGEPVSGVMRVLLHTMTGPLEELISAGEPVSGVLRDTLHTVVGPLDELVASGQPISGVLRDPLVNYTDWLLDPDKLISSGEPVSGVLT